MAISIIGRFPGWLHRPTAMGCQDASGTPPGAGPRALTALRALFEAGQTPSRSGLPPRGPANPGWPAGRHEQQGGERVAGGRRGGGGRCLPLLTGCSGGPKRAGHATTPAQGGTPDGVGQYRRHGRAGRAGRRENPRGWPGLSGTRTPAAPSSAFVSPSAGRQSAADWLGRDLPSVGRDADCTSRLDRGFEHHADAFGLAVTAVWLGGAVLAWILVAWRCYQDVSAPTVFRPSPV